MNLTKSKKIEPENCKFKIELTGKEAIQFCEELNKIGFEINHSGVISIPRGVTAEVFMVLSDALEDEGLIPMTEGRTKGENTYPRLENDNIEVEKWK